MYIRNCPKCGIELEYSSKLSWVHANKKQTKCKRCTSQSNGKVKNFLEQNKEKIIELYSDNHSVLEISKILDLKDRGPLDDFFTRNEIDKRRYHRPRQSIKRWDGAEEISGNFMTSFRHGAISRNLEFSIDKKYIASVLHKQDYKCKLSGLDINVDKFTKDIRTASLDRIDSEFGYIEGNIQFVHKKINTIKWNLTNLEFYELCKRITFNNSFQVKNNPNISRIDKRFWSKITERGAKRRGIEVKITNFESPYSWS